MVLGQQGLRTGLTMGVGLMAGLAMAMDSAAAAERVVLTYGSLSLEIPIGELDTLAETGRPLRNWIACWP
jgi:thiamine pyrophosphate-dependent acetolactate synthase large subunit-like protein